MSWCGGLFICCRDSRRTGESGSPPSTYPPHEEPGADPPAHAQLPSRPEPEPPLESYVVKAAVLAWPSISSRLSEHDKRGKHFGSSPGCIFSGDLRKQRGTRAMEKSVCPSDGAGRPQYHSDGHDHPEDTPNCSSGITQRVSPSPGRKLRAPDQPAAKESHGFSRCITG